MVSCPLFREFAAGALCLSLMCVCICVCVRTHRFFFFKKKTWWERGISPRLGQCPICSCTLLDCKCEKMCLEEYKLRPSALMQNLTFVVLRSAQGRERATAPTLPHGLPREQISRFSLSLFYQVFFTGKGTRKPERCFPPSPAHWPLLQHRRFEL